jgi:hypothetical protein
MNIPELKKLFNRLNVKKIEDKPYYIVIGTYKSKEIGPVAGIIAGSNIEFHARIINKEINKNGKSTLERTEYHPDGPTLSIKIYKEQMLKLKNSK